MEIKPKIFCKLAVGIMVIQFTNKETSRMFTHMYLKIFKGFSDVPNICQSFHSSFRKHLKQKKSVSFIKFDTFTLTDVSLAKSSVT